VFVKMHVIVLICVCTILPRSIIQCLWAALALFFSWVARPGSLAGPLPCNCQPQCCQPANCVVRSVPCHASATKGFSQVGKP